MSKKLSITLADEDGVVFATHKLVPRTALALLTMIRDDLEDDFYLGLKGRAAMILGQLDDKELEQALDDAGMFILDLRTACDRILV